MSKNVKARVEAMDALWDELNKAEKKHPSWPTDAIRAAAVISEESGELVQAANELVYAGGDIEAMRIEAAQVGASAMRFLMHIEEYERKRDSKC